MATTSKAATHLMPSGQAEAGGDASSRVNNPGAAVAPERVHTLLDTLRAQVQKDGKVYSGGGSVDLVRRVTSSNTSRRSLADHHESPRRSVWGNYQ
jgi:hypothetical protein